MPRAQQFGTAKIRAQATYDITLEAWGADYNDPYDFLNILLDGSQIDSTGNNNYAYYNNREVQQADACRRAARRRSPRCCLPGSRQEIMTEDPPWAPTNYRNDRVFLSNRFGCIIVNEAAHQVPTWPPCASSNIRSSSDDVGRRPAAAPHRFPDPPLLR